MLSRVLRGTAPTVAFYLEVDGEPVTGAEPTVKITRANGEELAAGLAATEDGEGRYTLDLTPEHTAQLDRLTLDIDAAAGQSFTHYVEVAGGFLFTLAQARKLDPLDLTGEYPTHRIEEARTAVEESLEEACGVAFVPRYARERHDGGGEFILLRPRPLGVLTCTVDGVAVDPADIALYEDGRAHLRGGWPGGRQSVVIEYAHGYQYPPGRVSQAALRVTRDLLVDSPVSDRAISVTAPDGTTQQYVTPGVRQAVFAVPEANAVVQQYSVNVGVA